MENKAESLYFHAMVSHRVESSRMDHLNNVRDQRKLQKNWQP